MERIVILFLGMLFALSVPSFTWADTKNIGVISAQVAKQESPTPTPITTPTPIPSPTPAQPELQTSPVPTTIPVPSPTPISPEIETDEPPQAPIEVVPEEPDPIEGPDEPEPLEGPGETL